MPATTKSKAIAAISELPDDTTTEEIIERLIVLAEIEKGIADDDAGRHVDHEAVKQEFLGG